MASPRDEHIVIPQRWTRIEALYHSALSLPPSDRETFLKASCGEDVQLFHEVNSLIAYSEDSFMQTPALQEALQLITKLQKEESERPILTNLEWTVEWSKTFFETPRKTWRSAALNPILPGELLASRYRIIRAIGQGGMGQVFEAEDLKLRKKVALKSIRSEIAADPESLYRFKNEFRALTDVIHPSLVTLYDVFSDGEMWFFTMELVRGLNFVDYTKCDDSCRSRLRRALRQLVEAVLALHAAGKLHRDIKPLNVLVEDDNRLTLIDFGLVTEFISKTCNIGSFWRVPLPTCHRSKRWVKNFEKLATGTASEHCYMRPSPASFPSRVTTSLFSGRKSPENHRLRQKLPLVFRKILIT